MKKLMKKLLVMVLIATMLPAAAAANEVDVYPIAMVNVNADSWLNVRQGPEKDVIGFLPPKTDVVILAEVGDWAFVSTVARMNEGKGPIGWVSARYLIKYSAFVQKKDAQRANAGQW